MASKADAAAAADAAPKMEWKPKVQMGLDIVGALMGIMVIITCIINMAGLPLLFGAFQLAVFTVPATCTGGGDPLATDGCMTAYFNVRWQLGVFSFMVLVAGFFPIGWALRSYSKQGAIAVIADLLKSSQYGGGIERLWVATPIVTWFALGLATLGMASILGFAVGLSCIVLSFFYIILAFFE